MRKTKFLPKFLPRQKIPYDCQPKVEATCSASVKGSNGLAMTPEMPKSANWRRSADGTLAMSKNCRQLFAELCLGQENLPRR